MPANPAGVNVALVSEDIWQEWAGVQSVLTGDYRSMDLREERRLELQLGCRTVPDGLEPAQTLRLIWQGKANGDPYSFVSADGLSTYRFPQPGDEYYLGQTLTNDYSFYVAKEFVVSQPEESSPAYKRIKVTYVLYYDPLLEPAVVEGDYQAWQRVIEEAYGDSPLTRLPISNAAGNVPITNSAYQAFDPPPTRLEPYYVIKITTNKAMNAWDPNSVLVNYVQRTNSVDFLVRQPDGTVITFPVGTVLLDVPPKFQNDFRTAPGEPGGGVAFVKTTWLFKVREIGWDLRIADLGFQKWNFDTNEPEQIIIDARQCRNPQKLDGLGGVLPPGAAPVYLNFHTFKTADFNQLHLFPGF